MVCLVYRPRKLNNEERTSTNKTIIDFHDYANAVELLQEEKPDIVVAGGWSTALIGNALALAANFLQIPVVNWLQMPLFDDKISIKPTTTISKFLQSQNPTSDEKQFMLRGRFFMKRYAFFQNTQKAIGLKISERTSFFFDYLKKIFLPTNQVFNPKFSGNITFLSGEKLLKNLVELGFNKEKLVVTGFPAYDTAFQKLKNLQSTSSEKIHVLFAPTTFYEHGDWTREQRDKILTEIITNLDEHNDKISLTVKFTPRTQISVNIKKLLRKLILQYLYTKPKISFHY